MPSTKRVFVLPSCDQDTVSVLGGLLAALECVALVAGLADAQVVVVPITGDALDDAMWLPVMNAAADGAVRLVGVRLNGVRTGPAELGAVVRRMAAMTPEALHDAICLDESGSASGGLGNFPPKPNPCGAKR